MRWNGGWLPSFNQATCRSAKSSRYFSSNSLWIGFPPTLSSAQLLDSFCSRQRMLGVKWGAHSRGRCLELSGELILAAGAWHDYTQDSCHCSTRTLNQLDHLSQRVAEVVETRRLNPRSFYLELSTLTSEVSYYLVRKWTQRPWTVTHWKHFDRFL